MGTALKVEESEEFNAGGGWSDCGLPFCISSNKSTTDQKKCLSVTQYALFKMGENLMT